MRNYYVVLHENNEDENFEIIENPKAFPIHPSNSYENRIERLHDLFVIIFSDRGIDEQEAYLIKRYAIG